MLSDSALAEAARYCDNDLALVLGERLRDLLDVEDELEDAKGEIKTLDHRVEWLKAEVAELQAHIDATRGYGPDE
jgi:predicted  nucleic acid-binding Zn-ribbon protein